MINKIHHMDCLEGMKKIPDNSIDSCVTDPPYGLSKEPDIREVLKKWLNNEPYDHKHAGFMGKTWDSFVPHPDIWREVYRVLKPGAHALVFAGTRTQDLMTISLRLAGFEVRDVIEWLYFNGFPKSMDVSKAIDQKLGAERKLIGLKYNKGRAKANVYAGQWNIESEFDKVTAPATELAKKWNGWGTALKPAHEPIIVVRKPLIDADTGRKLTIVDCVEKYGTGAINIDACRIGDEEITTNGRGSMSGATPIVPQSVDYVGTTHTGRFPANCITLDDNQFYSKYFNITPPELSKKASRKDRDSDWKGSEIKVEGKLPKHVFGDGFNSATKVRKDGDEEVIRNGELPEGRTLLKNNHPTVKPVDLMAWLVRLTTPPGGIVLDPFAGSGSTLVAAKREGFNFIGFELEKEYVEIAEARISGEPEQKALFYLG